MINIDQTPLPFVLASCYTIEKKGNQCVPVAETTDYRQITGTFGGTWVEISCQCKSFTKATPNSLNQHMGSFKKTFTRSFQFLNPPLPCSFLLVLNVPPPLTPPHPELTFTLVICHHPLSLSFLPSPYPSKKVPQRLWRLFWIKNSGGEKREKN